MTNLLEQKKKTFERIRAMQISDVHFEQNLFILQIKNKICEPRDY